MLVRARADSLPTRPGTCGGRVGRDDTNDDGSANIADAIRTLEFLFSGGSPPPLPFPGPGTDPTADPLGC